MVASEEVVLLTRVADRGNMVTNPIQDVIQVGERETSEGVTETGVTTGDIKQKAGLPAFLLIDS